MYTFRVGDLQIMKLVQFISSDGVKHEVEENSYADQTMRDDARFILINGDGDKRPVPAIESAVETNDTGAARLVTPSEMIRELMAIKEKKLWRSLGSKSFGHFLDSDEVPFGRTKFYQLKDLLLAEGDDRFNSLMADKIPFIALT